MIPTQADIRTAQAIGTSHQFDAIEERLHDIHKKIEQQRANNSTNDGIDKVSSTKKNAWDWTDSYKQWSAWEDMEELQAKKKFEENRLESLIEKQNVMQHYHDHSKEKEFFDLPEEIKMQKCEDYRTLGNYLFEQGSFAKAAERYQVAIAYYEYCFPDDKEMQKSLDATRLACLCNIAFCYIRLGHYRKAIESANHVLHESPNHPKALFRRAQAYRHLDEYE
jgi:tetratricopeptide (TPR) repeat protein